MKKTKLLYLTDSYKKTHKATILEIVNKGDLTGLILDKTIFYPQGGGQSSDKGEIKGRSAKLAVTQVNYNNGNVLHLGKLTGNLRKGQKVELILNWDHRYRNMQAHTAGHLLDESVKEVAPEYRGIDARHGIGGKHYVTFEGVIDSTLKPVIEEKLTEIIKNNEPLQTRLVTKSQIEKEGIYLPFELPKNKPLRLLQIGMRESVPDGGTQLASTGESWFIELGEFEYQDNQTTIHYSVISKAQKAVVSGKISIRDLKAQIDELLGGFANATKDEKTRIKYLGKKGKINSLTALIPKLAKEDRSEAGKLINKVKASMEKRMTSEKQVTDEMWIDVTIPGKKLTDGHLHPITQAIDEITNIFRGIGFTRVRYPEVDYDWYVFESLNMPPDHPARDEWETFFVDAPKNSKKGGQVLTTHTSNGQVREMERVGKPPIRMLNIGKCDRRQQDVTHTAMFHQFEGLVIDEGINIQHLKGTLDYFARKYYGPKAKSRIRPFMFKFTEPSFEVDFSCVHCDGKGCRFCKSGWHEVGGSGMVHPNVLKAGGIDPEKYTGFAFGWGVERVYTLKPGLELDDIRPLYSNSLDFLEQF